MTLPEVAASWRNTVSRKPSDDLTRKFVESIVAEFEADPDFRLRERVDEFGMVLAAHGHAAGVTSATCEFCTTLKLYNETFVTLDRPPGPTLRERVEKLAKFYEEGEHYEGGRIGPFTVMPSTHDLTDEGVASRIRAALNPPKETDR